MKTKNEKIRLDVLVIVATVFATIAMVSQALLIVKLLGIIKENELVFKRLERQLQMSINRQVVQGPGLGH